MKRTLLVMATLFCGCAGKRVTLQMNQRMQAFVGATEVDLVRMMGTPAGVGSAGDVLWPQGAGVPPIRGCGPVPHCKDEHKVYTFFYTWMDRGYYRAATPPTTTTTVTQKPGILIPAGGIIIDTSKTEATTTTTPGREGIAIPPSQRRAPRMFWIGDDGKVYWWLWSEREGGEARTAGI